MNAVVVVSLQGFARLVIRLIGILAGSFMTGLGLFEINILTSSRICQDATGGSGFYGCDLYVLYAQTIVFLLAGVAIVVFSMRPKIIQALPFPSNFETQSSGDNAASEHE